MRRAVAALLVVVGVLAASTSAFAYEIRGYDPEDRAGSVDVRSTILRVERANAGRVLVLVVRAYEDYGIWWGMKVRLDAQDGSRLTDHIVSLWNWDISAVPGNGCSVWEAGKPKASRLGAFRQNGKAVRCRLPIRWIKPDSQIGWRIVSGSTTEEGDVERAPDAGWYG